MVGGSHERHRVINTPDQRPRVFVSSTLQELAAERQAVRDAVTRLRLPRLIYVKSPAPERDPQLTRMLAGAGRDPAE